MLGILEIQVREASSRPISVCVCVYLSDSRPASAHLPRMTCSTRCHVKLVSSAQITTANPSPRKRHALKYNIDRERKGGGPNR